MAGRPRAWLCLVTDRRRLGEALDEAARLDALIELVAAAARAGVDLVQIRERDLPARSLLALVRRAVDAVQGTGARVVVNDRVDVAVAAGAAGVHLRGDSPPAPRVRALLPPGALLGRSVHSEREAREAVSAGGLDYLVVGTLFATPSKAASTPRLGLEVLARIVGTVRLPVLGIGGISLLTAPAVAETGAGIAAVGLFLPERGETPAEAAARVVPRVRAWLDEAAAG
jgi:thiamine-phosphate pyrophosphorylase